MLSKSLKAERYLSRVEEITPSYLLLALPMAKGVPVLPVPNSVIYGRVVMEGSVWHFASRFYDKRLHPLPVWVCSPPYDFEKIQLRAFVRLDTSLQVSLRPADAEENAPPLAATSKNISGGGVQIVTREPLPAGAQVMVEIDLGEFKVFSGWAQVVRSENDSLRKICCLGLKFVDLPERERDKIIKYIFKKQLERRQKGFGQ